jgi:hypothetical protein
VHALEKAQERRKTDEEDDKPNPTSDRRFDFYLPISVSPGPEPIEVTVRDIRRCGTHSPK